MMKLTLTFSFLSLLLVNLAFAGNSREGFAVSGAKPVRDTTITPAQALIAAAMPNTNVIALIENQGIASNTIRLNPGAKSFVTYYMSKNTVSYNGIKDRGLPYFK